VVPLTTNAAGGQVFYHRLFLRIKVLSKITFSPSAASHLLKPNLATSNILLKFACYANFVTIKIKREKQT